MPEKKERKTSVITLMARVAKLRMELSAAEKMLHDRASQMDPKELQAMQLAFADAAIGK